GDRRSRMRMREPAPEAVSLKLGGRPQVFQQKFRAGDNGDVFLRGRSEDHSVGKVLVRQLFFQVVQKRIVEWLGLAMPASSEQHYDRDELQIDLPSYRYHCSAWRFGRYGGRNRSSHFITVASSYTRTEAARSFWLKSG